MVVFHSHVATPRAGCFIIEIPLKIWWVYLEYSYFRKPPYGRFWCMLRYLLATNLKQPRAMFASPSPLAICLPLPEIPRTLTFTSFTIITICYTLLQNWHSKKKSKQYIMNISMIVNSLTITRHLTGNHNQNQIEVADHALHQCAQPWHAGERWCQIWRHPRTKLKFSRESHRYMMRKCWIFQFAEFFF